MQGNPVQVRSCSCSCKHQSFHLLKWEETQVDIIRKPLLAYQWEGRCLLGMQARIPAKLALKNDLFPGVG